MSVKSVEQLYRSTQAIHGESHAMNKGVPMCNVISDFLEKYNISDIAHVPKELRPLLMDRFKTVFEILENESQTMIAKCGVKSGCEFTLDQEMVHDVHLRTMLFTQDHFP